MSKQNRRTLALARRKKLLLDEIQQQRTQLAHLVNRGKRGISL